MKISSIQVNKFLLLAVCFLASQMLSAQDLGSILFGQDSKATYMGQFNYNGKRKNGFGIERYRNGSVYVGDFNEDKISGRGMMIALEKGISWSMSLRGATARRWDEVRLTTAKVHSSTVARLRATSLRAAAQAVQNPRLSCKKLPRASIGGKV